MTDDEKTDLMTRLVEEATEAAKEAIVAVSDKYPEGDFGQIGIMSLAAMQVYYASLVANLKSHGKYATEFLCKEALAAHEAMIEPLLAAMRRVGGKDEDRTVN